MTTHAVIEATGAEPIQRPWPNFMRIGMQPLIALQKDFRALDETLKEIGEVGGPKTVRQTRRIMLELDVFVPAVTFVGQIKSGKTTLVNAVAGRPGLLPADVNPWTSVVTSLHLGHMRGPDDPVASFTLFEAEEWDHLMQNGGRIGELSARAGAEKEHARLSAQIAEMREKTKARLGRKFEMLLGQTHKFNSMDDDLIQRYVCLGDDFDTSDETQHQGQFADLTKSAELYFDAPHLPRPLTLRDTPGMNDTFLMREQITINAIRDSKLCVVVLSAHQALSSVDMGLIRMIANVKSRQVVIFVNRIDELADPKAQLVEIRDSLKKTLAENNGPEDPTIIFGSALWANAALTGEIASLPASSAAALGLYQAMFGSAKMEALDPATRAWVLSGVPRLYETIGQRIAEGEGLRALTHARRRSANIVLGLRSTANLVSLRAKAGQVQKPPTGEISARMKRIAEDAATQLDRMLEGLLSGFADRVDQAHERYNARALDALLTHLEQNGEDKVWSYSADGLRMLMRTSYQVMTSRFRTQLDSLLSHTATRLATAYGDIFQVTSENFQVETPPIPELPAPVGLARTIVLDVSSAWWKRWWGKRRGYGAFAKGFQELIETETTPLVEDLKTAQAKELRETATAVLNGFLEDQYMIMSEICEKSQVGLDDLHELFGVTQQKEREDMFNALLAKLAVDPADLETAETAQS